MGQTYREACQGTFNACIVWCILFEFQLYSISLINSVLLTNFSQHFTYFQRATLTDLERFKVSKAKQARNKVIRRAFFSLRKKGTKTHENTRKRIEKLRAKAKSSKQSKPKAKA